VPVGALLLAVGTNNLLLLNYVHVLTAILWTGTDIFMGFVLGPILRKVSLSTRREIITWLMPKMIFYMTTVSSVTTTAGYFLAARLGLLAVGPPVYYWMLGLFVVVAVLFIQGLGFLLPTNLRVFFELRKAQPDIAKIQRLTRRYIRVVASQAVTQLITIFLMANFATGFPLTF